jgi:hypothetical protein
MADAVMAEGRSMKRGAYRLLTVYHEGSKIMKLTKKILGQIILRGLRVTSSLREREVPK